MDDSWNEFKGRMIGLKGLAAIGISDILGNALSVFFWFYIASVLEPSQYGHLQYFIGVVGTSFSFALIGTQSTMTVYSAKNLNIQATLYLLSLISGLVGVVILFLIFYRIDIGFLLLAYIISSMVIGDLLGRKVYSHYSKFVLIQKSLTIFLGIGFHHLFGFSGILYALALSYLPFVIPSFRIFKTTKIDFIFLKNNIKFVTNNYIISVTAGLNGQIDKLIIATIIGFAFLGSYSLALQVIAILAMINEISFKYLLSQDASGILNIKLKKYLILISIIIVGITLIFSPTLIPLFFPKYTEAVSIIQIMSFSVIFSSISVVLSSQLLGKEKSKFVLFGSITSLILMISGIITLNQLFGSIGVAVAYVLASVGNIICLYYGTHKHVK
ncbi:MAG: polysaccharide biosynthesis C-terminal domain-containing protein [Nitrososphaerota archaeon]